MTASAPRSEHQPAPTEPTAVGERFDRVARLLGEPALERLARAHVIVFGLGGVGSFAAEALARSGVGRLTLVDGERICETNVNRQLHALDGEVGHYKAEVMAERLRRINPAARLEAVAEFYGPENADRLLGSTREPAAPATAADFIVDAIDSVTPKLHLLARCLREGRPVVSSMGAAARLDPTRVRVTDLSESHTDQFAKDVRKYLRRKHGIACGDGPTGILAVWSEEPARPTLSRAGDAANGIPGVRPLEPGMRRRAPKCYGSAAFVTGVFGMTCASVAVQHILSLPR